MERPDLSSLSNEQLEYVCHLESALTGASDLTVELNLVKKDIALEVSKIRSEGNILQNDKVFSKLVTLMEKESRGKTAVKKDKEVKEPEAKVVDLPQGDSFFEKKLKEKNGRQT